MIFVADKYQLYYLFAAAWQESIKYSIYWFASVAIASQGQANWQCACWLPSTSMQLHGSCRGSCRELDRKGICLKFREHRQTTTTVLYVFRCVVNNDLRGLEGEHDTIMSFLFDKRGIEIEKPDRDVTCHCIVDRRRKLRYDWNKFRFRISTIFHTGEKTNWFCFSEFIWPRTSWIIIVYPVNKIKTFLSGNKLRRNPHPL